MSIAPSTQGVCLGQYSWMTNAFGQSPCLLGSYLQSACGSNWNVPNLPPGDQYFGPQANETDICLCSSVTYNVVSACATCQSGTYITWPAWKGPCSQSIVGLGTFSAQVPPQTSVPRWAYQDPTTEPGDTFNVTFAQQVANQHLPDVTTSGSASYKSNSSSAPIGAIVGGVLGGLATIAILGILTWWFLRKRHGSKASQAPSKQYIDKWSKAVSAASDPRSPDGARSLSYTGSVAGDTPKERDYMMGSRMTPPESTAFASREGYVSHGSGLASSYPSAAMAHTGSGASNRGPVSPPSSTSGKGKKKKTFGSPQNNITPFLLPPVSPEPANQQSQPRISTSSSSGVRTQSPDTQLNTLAHRRQISPPELPSSIEYLGAKKGSMPQGQPQATLTTPPLNTAGQSHSSLGGRESRRSSTGSGQYSQVGSGVGPTTTSTSHYGGHAATPPSQYYNPDDSATYPFNPIERSLNSTQSPAVRHSQEHIPLGSSTFMPRSSMERLPMGVANATNPHTPVTPGENISLVGGYFPSTGASAHSHRAGTTAPSAYPHWLASSQVVPPLPPVDTSVRAEPPLPPEYSGSSHNAAMAGALGDRKIPLSSSMNSQPNRGPPAPSSQYGSDPRQTYLATASRPSPERLPVPPSSYSAGTGWTPHARTREEAEGEFNPWDVGR